jgi:ribonuclease-3
VIGAVFLDGGYESARLLVERAFSELLSAPRRPLRDAKSALQEWAQGRGLPTPTYTIVEQIGPNHAPRFKVMVTVSGAENGTGLGTSKRAAEQEAARSLLLREGVWTEEEHGVA